MSRDWIKFLSLIAAVIVLQLGWHGYASTDLPWADVLRAIYMHPADRSGNPLGPFADVFLPAFVIGVMGGFWLRGVRVRRLVLAVCPGVVFTLLVLQIVYMRLFDDWRAVMWWWPSNSSDDVPYAIAQFCFSWLCCAGGAWSGARQRKEEEGKRKEQQPRPHA